MKLPIKLAPGATIDLSDPQVMSDGMRVWVGAESGGGKSSCAALIAGQVMEHGIQTIILDAHGEYGTLTAYDPDVLMVGYDMPNSVGLWHAQDSIEKYLAYIAKGKSVFFNLKAWCDTEPEALDLFTIAFMKGLYGQQKLKPRRTLLIVEEASQFAPQVTSKGERAKVRIFIGVATGGRKYGLNTVFCTQRQALVDKSVLSQCNVRLFGRTSDANDWKAIRPYVPDNEDTGKPIVNFKAIRNFNSGQMLLLSRWFPEQIIQLNRPSVAPTLVVPSFLR